MTTDTKPDTAPAAAGDDADGARAAVRAAVFQVGEAVHSVRSRIPDAARASRDLAGVALERIESGSDQQISAGATMSLGLAVGLLLGGAPRILIAMALVPVAAIALFLLDRSGSRSGPSSRPLG